MTRCDNGHEHATRYEALTCVRSRAKATPQGAPEEPLPGSENPGTSDTIFRHGRAGRPGRPRVPLTEQKARDRQRAYRARRP